jgi:hypothetical protein
MCKEVVVVYFKILLSQNLLGGTEESHKHLSRRPRADVLTWYCTFRIRSRSRMTVSIRSFGLLLKLLCTPTLKPVSCIFLALSPSTPSLRSQPGD